MIQKESHLQDYLNIIMQRQWIIITFFIVLVTTVLIGSLKQTPIYRTTATLMIERTSPQVLAIQEVTPMGSDYYSYQNYYETQYKLITNPTVLKKVADLLGDKQSTDASKKITPLSKTLAKVVSVTPIKDSQLVEIHAEDPSPERAARIVNMVAEEYRNQNLERNINASNEAAQWLAKKIEEQREKLRNAESVLQTYREEHKINILPQVTTNEAAVENIMAEYAQLQARLANYSERYTDVHPEMIELKAQINSLKSKIDGLGNVETGDNTAEYRTLEREVQTNKHMYVVLLTRLKEIDLSGTLQSNNISIINKAEPPVKPIRPNVKLNTILAVIVGIVGGIGLAFFVDYLDTTVKSPEDIKETLGLRFLGGIPNIEGKEEIKRDKIVHIEPHSIIAEAYRAIRTEVSQSMNEMERAKVLLVTSAEPRAGKTMTISNLAIAFAQNGAKTIIVDADLRKPQLHKIFNLDKQLGLTEYLSGDKKIDAVIKKTEIENLMVLTSGKMPSNPAEVLGLMKIEQLFNELRQRFDFILLDSPPVISVTDSIILANKVDGVIEIVRSGQAHAPMILRANERLVNTKAQILGAILNDVSISHGNYYYYYNKYYHYYGEDSRRRDQSRRRQRGENSAGTTEKNLQKIEDSEALVMAKDN